MEGTTTLQMILNDQRKGMGWSKFYIDGLRLDMDEIAFANVAWCATKGNIYPGTVLRRCFDQHTARLLELLSPHVVLAAGRKAQAFEPAVSGLSCKPRFLSVLHHAHGEGQAAGHRELTRVRSNLKAAMVDGRHAG